MSRLAIAYMSSIGVALAVACVPPARRLPDQLPEVSGLAFDRRGRLYAVNDGGNAPRLYRLAEDFRSVSDTLSLPRNVDVEAVAYDGRADELVVCDVGDNRRARSLVHVYRRALRRDVGAPADQADLAYGTGAAYDCEACMMRGDSLTLVTKARTLGGSRTRTAYVFGADLRRDTVLRLLDSFALRRRSVTDAVSLGGDTIAVLAYDFRLLGIFPLSKTSLYVGTLADFRENRARRRPVRAPFTLTQYEAVAHPHDGTRRLLLASERTPLTPQRWRWVRY